MRQELFKLSRAVNNCDSESHFFHSAQRHNKIVKKCRQWENADGADNPNNTDNSDNLDNAADLVGSLYHWLGTLTVEE